MNSKNWEWEWVRAQPQDIKDLIGYTPRRRSDSNLGLINVYDRRFIFLLIYNFLQLSKLYLIFIPVRAL